MFSLPARNTSSNKMQEKFTNEEVRKIMEEVLRRHTWMKDGTTYVGNGTFKIREAVVMLERDYPQVFGK